MSCFLKEEPGQIIAVLSFKRDELLYDIENYAFIEGSIMRTESAHERHMVQDVGQEGNVDRVIRVIGLYVAKCREILYAFTKSKIHRPWLDDVLRDPKVYGIVLSLPEGFSQTTLSLLEKLIHEYIVCGAVADWLSITDREKSELWWQKSMEAKGEIESHMGRRMTRVRRRMHPF